MMTPEAVTQALRDAAGGAGLDPDDDQLRAMISNAAHGWLLEQEWEDRRTTLLRQVAAFIRGVDHLHFDPADIPDTVLEQLARARAVVAEIDRLDLIDAESQL